MVMKHMISKYISSKLRGQNALISEHINSSYFPLSKTILLQVTCNLKQTKYRVPGIGLSPNIPIVDSSVYDACWFMFALRTSKVQHFPITYSQYT